MGKLLFFLKYVSSYVYLIHKDNKSAERPLTCSSIFNVYQ
jgi:hypothetical protein